jgi:Fanconi-associated nuclease 1
MILHEAPVDLVHYDPVPLNKRNGSKVEYYIDDNEDITIGPEALAIIHYQSLGWDGVHCESGAFTMLFALVFWDILFCHVPGVFQTPFQTSPLDLRTDEFYCNRKELIEERLELVRNNEYSTSNLLKTFNSNEGTLCIGVNWEYYSAQFLCNVFESLGGVASAVILKNLAMDYRNHASGMPDLVLWRDGQVKLVEVKSETDKLSDQQRYWMKILTENSIPVTLFQINERFMSDYRT